MVPCKTISGATRANDPAHSQHKSFNTKMSKHVIFIYTSWNTSNCVVIINEFQWQFPWLPANLTCASKICAFTQHKSFNTRMSKHVIFIYTSWKTSNCVKIINEFQWQFPRLPANLQKLLNLSFSDETFLPSRKTQWDGVFVNMIHSVPAFTGIVAKSPFGCS